ncbi:MAG: hypothetical protein AB7F86_06285 [Bdellovibrionales bacterium]
MKAWSLEEVDNMTRTLGVLKGARLQEVLTSDRDIILGFYIDRGLVWLWIDLNPLWPSALPWEEPPFQPVQRPSPMKLFIRAHLLGQKVSHVERIQDLGRVIRIGFQGGSNLEIRLVPHAPNLIVFHGEKSVAWHKPQELLGTGPEFSGDEVRALQDLREIWLGQRRAPSKKSKKPSGAGSDPSQTLAKKMKALQKVEEELSRKRALPWREIGNWIKENQTLSVPSEWVAFVDRKRNLAWNIEECFRRAKEVEQKISGTETRAKTLRAEVARLKSGGSLQVKSQSRPPEREVGVQGRTLRVSEQITAFAGKNAADNLKLLRRAKPWDLWLHIQDRPSAHVVVFRNKSTPVSDAVLSQVMEWFVRLQLGSKMKQHSGERWKFIVAECRHVSPIKGDRLGRVTYKDERNLIYRVP